MPHQNVGPRVAPAGSPASSCCMSPSIVIMTCRIPTCCPAAPVLWQCPPVLPPELFEPAPSHGTQLITCFVRWVMHAVLCMLSCARCPVHAVLCTLSCACCPVHAVLCTHAMCNARCPVHAVLCTLSCACCPVHAVLCTLSCVSCACLPVLVTWRSLCTSSRCARARWGTSRACTGKKDMRREGYAARHIGVM